MIIHQKIAIIFEKTMKAYSKVVMLSLKTYENILNFNFLIGGRGIRHIDCLCKCFDAVIYQCKKQLSVVNFIYRLKNFKSTLITRDEFDVKDEIPDIFTPY